MVNLATGLLRLHTLILFQTHYKMLNTAVTTAANEVKTACGEWANGSDGCTISIITLSESGTAHCHYNATPIQSVCQDQHIVLPPCHVTPEVKLGRHQVCHSCKLEINIASSYWVIRYVLIQYTHRSST